MQQRPYALLPKRAGKIWFFSYFIKTVSGKEQGSCSPRIEARGERDAVFGLKV
jgi:hypothetical protein